ncbi:hypothetical protein [Endozoicomonas sp. SESOKO1]|uniref:hypothetical protein n=1 Tax=Endozoicomonas sp. SESOKO1 TaxID=2828742 RepID=UPI0035A0B76A
MAEPDRDMVFDSGEALSETYSFTSTEDLKACLHQFVDFFNEKMAKPFKWFYKGRPLQV